LVGSSTMVTMFVFSVEIVFPLLWSTVILYNFENDVHGAI
jgi:hypothetical protein